MATQTTNAVHSLNDFAGITPACPQSANHKRTKVYRADFGPGKVVARCRCDECGASFYYDLDSDRALSQIKTARPNIR
jgi:transposase-like protein